MNRITMKLTKNKKVKRLAIIGTVGVPAKYGGFETLVDNLLDKLANNYKITIYCSKKNYTKNERVKYYKGAKLVYLPFSANGVQSIIYDIISIFHSIFIADTLIILGVSGGIAIPFVRWFTNKKIIVNIDGQEWKRDKWNSTAKKFLKTSEKIAVKYSHADITDNLSIKRYTSLFYNTLSILIEYGGDHVLNIKPNDNDLLKYNFLNKSYFFNVARIEPENHIHTILESFRNTHKELVMVGNWNNSEYGINLKELYTKEPNITILDAIYNQKELDLIRGNCFAYIHGHSAGGTNPSLVEAMNLGLPVIAFDVSYNVTTTENKALYFKNSDDLKSKIENITYSELLKNKKKMYEIAKRRYTWEVISKKYSNLIKSFDYKYEKSNLKSKMQTYFSKNELNKNESGHLKNTYKYYE